jgi:hypothetical protein
MNVLKQSKLSGHLERTQQPQRVGRKVPTSFAYILNNVNNLKNILDTTLLEAAAVKDDRVLEKVPISQLGKPNPKAIRTLSRSSNKVNIMP